MNPTRHEAHEAIARLWAILPVGAGQDFNIIITRLEKLENNQ